MTIRRCLVALAIVSFAVVFHLAVVEAADEPAKDEVVKYARFRVNDNITFGIVEGDNVREISGTIFGEWTKTDTVHALADVTLLVPTRPQHVFAMAGNYKSHLQDAEIPPKFRIPQPFFKSPSSLVRHEGWIIIPKDATEQVHFEAEMVVVIGKRARKVSKEDALDYVLGVTCGNDVSERYWQNDEENKDVQWWRAKGADTFGPCGPFIVAGLDYDDLLLTLRLNGEVKQEERTSQMIHDVATQVSFISKHVTLLPGDLIFTGTSGKTSALHPRDVVEVELQGVGILRNRVGREK
ncbi:MAG: fumarylacetoacetate hydrolase family protein [Planctomycetota bacterium]|nr:fumarylacetoacetate hydrolase family protein [Planctomycetota bacterium]